MGLMIGIGIGVWLFTVAFIMFWFHRSCKNYNEAKKYEEYDDVPTCYVHCLYNPDEVKTFYEIPDALSDLIKGTNTELSFTECLAQLVDPYRKENL